MSNSTRVRRVLAAGAGAMVLSAVAAPVASAQPYGYQPPPPPSYSDACRSDRTNRTALGALLGAGAGALLGSHVAANHHRTDGSIVGGLLGAAGGGLIAHDSSATCPQDQAYAPPPPPPVAEAPPPPPAYYQAPRGYDARFDDGHWAYGPRGVRLRIVDRPAGPDGCALAESPVYMPDGDVQHRLVRVCMDPSGRYQVVD